MKKFFFPVLLAFLILGSAFFWFYMFNATPATQTESYASEPVNETVTMYRSDGCDCCLKWAKHMEDNGFRVFVETVDDIYDIKALNGVPRTLSSCHTAVVGDYIVEGHVPANDVKRLLKEKPDAIGISVPGMPVGSPGMEGSFMQKYNVVLFESETEHFVFSSYN